MNKLVKNLFMIIVCLVKIVRIVQESMVVAVVVKDALQLVKQTVMHALAVQVDVKDLVKYVLVVQAHVKVDARQAVKPDALVHVKTAIVDVMALVIVVVQNARVV